MQLCPYRNLQSPNHDFERFMNAFYIAPAQMTKPKVPKPVCASAHILHVVAQGSGDKPLVAGLAIGHMDAKDTVDVAVWEPVPRTNWFKNYQPLLGRRPLSQRGHETRAQGQHSARGHS
jgi:hypothetical protein